MNTAGLSDKTRADRLTIVKQWYKWSVMKAKMMLLNPFAGEEIFDPPPTPQPCFTPTQVALLLATADKEHEGPVYAVMAYLGRRGGDLLDQLRGGRAETIEIDRLTPEQPVVMLPGTVRPLRAWVLTRSQRLVVLSLMS